MKLRKFFGPTSRAVLEQLRTELGPDAMIVANNASADGIEITALPTSALPQILAEPQTPIPPAVPLATQQGRRAHRAAPHCGPAAHTQGRQSLAYDAMYTAAGTLDTQARITQFAPLVRRMAHHLAARLPSSVQVDDLIQAGMIGLMDAAARFEESQGNQFETYATQRIRGAMLDELRQNDWLPRSTRKALRRIESAMHKLEQRLGRAPSETELAKELKVSLGEYQSMLQEARGYELLHIEDFSRDDDDDYLERHLPDERENPFERYKDARFRAALVTAIEGLPEREKLLMGLYYEQELNFKEIAAVLEVSESRVCQLHSQAVARLRSKLKGWT
jgi:RNA polymerase sigma factor for flagellar operon FliA